MVNAENILKQQLLESLDDNHFKRKIQSYINYSNRIPAGIIHHLYDDHGTISPIYIEESEQKIKQQWSLLDPMVDIFE